MKAQGATGAAPRGATRRAAGFTMIELMIVITMIAVASAVVSLALRDPAATRLDQEGARLVALLEAARSEARADGLHATWQPRTGEETGLGFRFDGLPRSVTFQTNWLTPGVTAQVLGAPAVLLGPEPMIGAQTIVLRLDDKMLSLSTDGLGPFVVSGDVQTR
ncbi:MAG TPA: prepilin-type N-terminal cleavage/methylation domain-containing protein [Burkholderiaceae bacterium]|jgi:general secretion pathway protein H